MIEDLMHILDPSPYCNNVWNFVFPQLEDNEDEIILSSEEKKLIVDQITEVKEHLNSAKIYVKDGNFDKAIRDLENAIERINVL